MNLRSCLPLLGLLVLVGGVRADQPSNAPIQVNIGAKFDLGKKDYLRGWYLFWPDYALAQPRMPLPYPYWPQQSVAAPLPPPISNPPASGPAVPPVPFQLPPRENLTPPSSPGPASSGLGSTESSFQPVSYPVVAPAYWWQK